MVRLRSPTQTATGAVALHWLKGFHDKAAPTDKFHTFKKIVRPLDPTKNATVRIIKIGELADDQSNTSTTLEFKKDIDKNFEKAGYTISKGTYIWVVNPLGPDYRAKFDSYDGDDKIKLEAAMKDEDGKAPNATRCYTTT